MMMMMMMMMMIWKSDMPSLTSLLSRNSASSSYMSFSTSSPSFVSRRLNNRRLRLPSLQESSSSSIDADTAPHRQDHAGVSAAAVQLRACVSEARDVKDGIWCLSRLLSRLPPALEHRALAVAQEVAPTVDKRTPPQGLTINLETCLGQARSPDARTFCLADLLARIPPKALALAARQAEETPVVDWNGTSADATQDAESFLSCVQSSETVDEGIVCLGTLLSDLPQALVERSTRLLTSLPPRTVNTDPSEMQTPNFVKCLKLASSGDSAIYCLSNYLIHLPQDQVERAYIFYKTQRLHPTLEDVDREGVFKSTAKTALNDVGLG